MSTLKNKTIVITGASRGLGAAMARKFAAEGANVAILAKTAEPHPKLPGTIYSVAEEVEALGGKALPIQLDLRDADATVTAINQVAEHFGSIDVLVNNASALSLSTLEDTSVKRLDLMYQVNMRATYVCSQACLPYLKKQPGAQILTIAPPISLNPKWFKTAVPYTMTKYGMSLAVIGLAEECRDEGIAVNALWPKTTIDTAAVRVNFPPEVLAASRHASIVADAACFILQKQDFVTGQFFLDEDVLRDVGVTDFSKYAVDASKMPQPDFYVD